MKKNLVCWEKKRYYEYKDWLCTDEGLKQEQCFVYVAEGAIRDEFGMFRLIKQPSYEEFIKFPWLHGIYTAVTYPERHNIKT